MPYFKAFSIRMFLNVILRSSERDMVRMSSYPWISPVFPEFDLMRMALSPSTITLSLNVMSFTVLSGKSEMPIRLWITHCSCPQQIQSTAHGRRGSTVR